jgi:hypothetical protein
MGLEGPCDPVLASKTKAMVCGMGTKKGMFNSGFGKGNKNTPKASLSSFGPFSYFLPGTEKQGANWETKAQGWK